MNRVCDFCGKGTGKLVTDDYGVHNHHSKCLKAHTAEMKAKVEARNA